jgi:hypothetical protein
MHSLEENLLLQAKLEVVSYNRLACLAFPELSVPIIRHPGPSPACGR